MVTAKEIREMTAARIAGKETGPPAVPSYETVPGYSTGSEGEPGFIHFSRWSRKSRKRLLPSAKSRSGGRLPKLKDGGPAPMTIKVDDSNFEAAETSPTALRPPHISPSNRLERSETGVTDRTTDSSSVLDSDILTDQQAMVKFVGDGSKPVPRLRWPNSTDERLEVMTQIKAALETLYQHLRPRSLAIKDVLPREYDECNRPQLVGVDENNNISIQTLFVGLRSIKKEKGKKKKKRVSALVGSPTRTRPASDAGKPPLDPAAIEAMIEFFDDDQSGEIELLEFMTAFRVANRLFLLGESDGKTLAWEKEEQKKKNNKPSSSSSSSSSKDERTTTTMERSRSASVDARDGFDAMSEIGGGGGSLGSLDDSFGSFDGANSLTSNLTGLASGVSFMTATVSGKGKVPRCPLRRDELEELGAWATADTNAGHRRRGVYQRHRFEMRLRLLRRAYSAGRAAYRARWAAAADDDPLPEEQPALYLQTGTPAFFNEEEDAEAAKQERFERRLEAVALADAERAANDVIGAGINWGDDLVTREEQEGIEEHMGVSQWAMAKSLRRLEKYLRSTHCQTLAGVLREIPCDILFEINGLVPFENLHNFFDSLHGPNPRVVKLLSLQEQKALATRQEREEKERQRAWLKAQEVQLELSGVAELIRKLQRHMRLKGLRMYELFTMIDTSGDQLIDRNELRAALLDICRPPPPPESRLATKKREEAMAAEAEAERRHEEEKAVMLERMRASEVSGAGEAFAKLDRFMRKYQLTAKTFFVATDKNSDGSLDVGELFAALQKAKCPMTKRQVRKMVSYLDQDGDMTMDEGELQAAITEYRAFKRAKKFMNQVLERSSSHEQLLPDRMITLLIRYLIGMGGTASGGSAYSISLDHLQAAVADARIIPLSKMFRQVRRAQDPALFEEMGIEDDSYTVEPHTPLPGDGDTADSPLRSPTPAKPDEGRQKSGIAMLKKIGGGTKALFQDDQPSSFTGDGDLNMKDAKEALKLNR
jgi:Ca2+-binding EF-hand superfamily protein